MATEYDFIIVGAGGSGAVLASRLARTPAAPSVLLVEAGGSNSDAALLSASQRFTLALAPSSPLNWSYKTVPQADAAGQEVDYSRGKGLGGSTAINFCTWTVGPKDDFDEWADIAGNKRFGWENVKRVLRRIENLDPHIPEESMRKWLYPSNKEHSTFGNVPLTYGDNWLPHLSDVWTAVEQCGQPTNPDVNNGNPIGLGMGSICIAEGNRATSSSTYLSHPPRNLHILTEAPVSRVLFEKKRATGIETVDGRRLLARNEVVLSAGALNTPQILMLSGVGPSEELNKHGISLLHESPLVGTNLQDHCFTSTGIVLEKDPNRPRGPPFNSTSPMGWFKLPAVTSSPEFQDLPLRVQKHIQKPTVPATEIASHAPNFFGNFTPSPSETYLGAICLIMNPQSRGTVTLRSSNPSDPPIMDPKFLSHPFDRRAMIEGLRETMRIQAAPVYAPRTTKRIGPKDTSDESILEHVKSYLMSSWHMSSTASMGRSEKEGVVDSAFKLYGVQGLRVVDLSVCPFVVNAHTMSTAYIVGEIGADVLAEEYSLGEVTVAEKAIKASI